ncbi:MAG: DNA-binding protein [Elusimicrobiota bacterium]
MNKLAAFRLPDSMINEVDSISKKLQRTKSFVIMEALKSYIGDIVDYQIALDRLNDPHDEIVTSKQMRGLLAK